MCSQALELDKTNIKALTRRAMARIYLGKLALASVDVKDAEACIKVSGHWMI